MAETGMVRRYQINLEGEPQSGGRHKSMSAFIAGRRCYSCQQALTGDMVYKSDPQDHVDQIINQCSSTPDYLLPDTPVKEAIFRIILANGNQKMSAKEVSDALTGRWSISAYPRDITPKTIGKVLDHAIGYSIIWTEEKETAPAAPPKPGRAERRK